MTRILVVGECVLDEVHTPDGMVAGHPGGSPANVAVGLGRLGQEVSLLTELGDDDAGAAIDAHLTASAVDVVRARSSARTPVARALLDDDGAATYEFDIAWTLEAPTIDDRAVAHLHTGSIAAHLEPGAATVERIVSQSRQRATISYDPNVRPTLVHDHEDIVARTERFVAMSDIVKASDEDLAWLYPGTPPEEAIAEWSRSGPALVIATLGAEGSWVSARGELLRIDPIRVAAVDSVGAGDSYMAALIDGLLREGWIGPEGRDRLRLATLDEISGAVRRAARAAAITVSRSGANPPTAAELDGTPGRAHAVS